MDLLDVPPCDGSFWSIVTILIGPEAGSKLQCYDSRTGEEPYVVVAVRHVDCCDIPAAIKGLRRHDPACIRAILENGVAKLGMRFEILPTAYVNCYTIDNEYMGTEELKIHYELKDIQDQMFSSLTARIRELEDEVRALRAK